MEPPQVLRQHSGPPIDSMDVDASLRSTPFYPVDEDDEITEEVEPGPSQKRCAHAATRVSTPRAQSIGRSLSQKWSRFEGRPSGDAHAVRPVQPRRIPDDYDSTNSIVTFAEAAASSLGIEAVGAKGMRLIELTEALADPEFQTSARFRVPAGACVVTQAFDRHLQLSPEIQTQLEALRGALSGGDSPASATLAKLRRAIQSAPLHDEFLHCLSAKLGKLGLDPAACRDQVTFAVRSSGSMEDMAAKSFAGQYDTVLNVPAEGIADAVKQCWASQYKDHVIPYLRDAISATKNGHGEVDLVACAKMGVVIQVMVLPSAAGVLFTIDPAGVDRAGDMVCEAVHGLGEGLVSGEITPHSFVVSAIDGSIRSKNATSQTRKVTWREGDGIVTTDTTPEEREAAPVDASILEGLGAAGLAIAAHYGTPQDVEWCVVGDKIFIVQTRPVTAFTYSRGCGEWHKVKNTPSCVFGESLISAARVDFVREHARRMGFAQIESDFPPWRFCFGRGYVNFEFEAHLQADFTATPEPIPGIENWWQSVEELGEELSEREKALLAPILPVSRSEQLRALSRQELREIFVWSVRKYRLACSLSWATGHIASVWEKKVDDWIKYLNHPDLSVEVLTMGLTSRGALTRLRDTARNFARQDGGSGAIASCIDSAAGSSKHFFESMQNCTGDGLLAQLKLEFENYLESFYYMAEEDEDLATMHWGEDPSFPATILFRSLTAALQHMSSCGISQGLDPNGAAQSQIGPKPVLRQDSAALQYEAGLQLAKQVINDDESIFWTDLNRLRRYLHAKEQIHVIYVKFGFILKRYALELGRRWIEQGILHQDADPADIFFLQYPQLEAKIHAAPADISRDLLAREVRWSRLERQIWRNYKRAYWIRGGKRRIFRSVVKATLPGHGDRAQSGQVYQGFACSPGRTGDAVEGSVRVVTSLVAQAENVVDGEILVATYTSPAWTPLFSLIQGLVLEDGGMLSHGAVVARECGIPAITQLKGATQLFRTGDVVRLDGVSGTLTVVRLADGRSSGETKR